MTRPVASLLLLAGALALLLAAGCASAPRQTAFMDEMGVTEPTARELRLRVYDLGLGFGAEVERTADLIMLATDDPRLQRRALQWKINGITVMNQAVFQSDPLAGVIDATVFTFQMRAFFADGAGKDLFEEWQPLVVATSDSLAARSLAMTRAIARSHEYPEARQFIEQWIGEHPLADLQFVRQSTSTHWMATVGGTPGGVASSVAEIEESMVDLLARMRSYAGDLPKQARWQFQLAALDVLEGQDMQAFFATIGDVEADITRIENRFTEFTLMVDAMYREAWQHVAAQQVQATADADRLLATALVAISTERDAVLLAIEESRVATLADLDEMRQSAIGETSTALRGAIDHLVWRLAQLLAGFLVVAGVIGWLLVRYARR